MNAASAIGASHGSATLEDIDLAPARSDQRWAVERLFGALHAHNATLDPLLRLGPGWVPGLHRHLDRAEADESGLTVLAWLDGAPVGLVMMDGHLDPDLFLNRHWAELVALYVDPSVRRRSLGRRLIDAGVRWARVKGFARVQLYVTASNAAGRELYRETGFHLCQEIWRLNIDHREESRHA